MANREPQGKLVADASVAQDEKKVEYVELIYDLVFVYMVGQTNAILHNFVGGFVDPVAFATYVLDTLAVIQIWSYTTFYVNLFGRNGVRDHVMMFVNMYLLYFMGQGTRADWQAYQTQYHLAWGLILLNIALNYLIESRRHRPQGQARTFTRSMARALAVEAVLVFVAAIPNPLFGSLMSFAAIVVGVVLTARTRASSCSVVNFMHLTERAMLFVVFTFGEMIVALASYFEGDGGWDGSNVYFSTMVFLIVVGLFLAYELLYDHVVNRECGHRGMRYMMLHIPIIFFLNNITASLEFAREPEISLVPKMIFLIVSFVGYYAFLFATRSYWKQRYATDKTLVVAPAAVTAAFVLLMLVFMNSMRVNVFISAAYVFVLFLTLYYHVKSTGMR